MATSVGYAIWYVFIHVQSIPVRLLSRTVIFAPAATNWGVDYAAIKLIAPSRPVNL